jgi:hypothetical protein
MRIRHAQGDVQEQDIHDGTNSSYSRSSSPERYMSDYDDDDVPLRRAHQDNHDPERVRRGSEGVELIPPQPWLAEESREWGDPLGNYGSDDEMG